MRTRTTLLTAVWSHSSKVAQTYDKMRNGIVKKVLFASSALVLTAGFAYAEVTISGDGRMGILDGYDTKDFSCDVCTDETDIGFTSRIRITFTAAGETDSGLSFGGSIRADNATAGATGTAGNVFFHSPFGKLSMGDVDGGAKGSVGHAAGVGLTGLRDVNEIVYIASAGTDPSLLFSHTLGGLSVNVSADNPSAESESFAGGVSYKFNDMLTVAAGGEKTDSIVLSYRNFLGTGLNVLNVQSGIDGEQFVVGATGKFGPVTAKGVVSDGELDDGNLDMRQYSASLEFSAGDQASLTGFFRNSEFKGEAYNNTKVRAFGAGASYDLGDGVSLKGGIVNLKLDSDSGTGNGDSTSFDLGLSFSF